MTKGEILSQKCNFLTAFLAQRQFFLGQKKWPSNDSGSENAGKFQRMEKEKCSNTLHNIFKHKKIRQRGKFITINKLEKTS